MKTIILYYSFGGSTRKWAKAEGALLDADVKEIMEKKKRGIVSAFLSGCPKAMKRKKVDVVWDEVSLDSYDKIILAAPIWAGYPAPAFNNMVDLIPEGKDVELYLMSGSGNSSKSRDGTIQMISGKNCRLIGYQDVKEVK